MAIFGATGIGKSTLMRNMIATDPRSGAGLTNIDPHGRLITNVSKTPDAIVSLESEYVT